MPAEKWSEAEVELIACGRIVQDKDASVPREEVERRFNRYVELVDALRGTEGVVAARALVRSMQATYDYGAYQVSLGKLLYCFPPDEVAEAVVAELPRLIAELPGWAGELLNALVQSEGRSAHLVHAFNSALSCAPESERELQVRFIREQEVEGWLEHKPGVLAA